MTRIAVLGGGVAGLAAARHLREAGNNVVVFDKGRRAAGRISTRREIRFDFDHGAQYFTARDSRFLSLVHELEKQGTLARWEGQIVSIDQNGSCIAVNSGERWVGVPGMSAVARALSRDLKIEAGTRITSPAFNSDQWTLQDEKGRNFGPFDGLISALPSTQAADLIEPHSALGARAREAEMSPCWAVMLGLVGRFDVPFDGAFIDGSPLAWVARNSSKPGRPAGESWVLHAGPGWSMDHLFDEPAVVQASLVRELKEVTGLELPRVAHVASHRWRYARLEEKRDLGGVLIDPELRMALCGDWCHGERVEGAWLSGVRAAESINAWTSMTG